MLTFNALSRLRFRGLGFLIAVLLLANCSRDPQKDSLALIRSGDEHVAKKQFAEALIQYRKAVQVRPNFGEARFKLAEAYVRASDLPRAFAEYVRAADLMPTNAAAQLRAGQFLLMASQYDDARARAQKVLQSEPRNVEALILLGNSMAGLGDVRGGIRQVEQAIENDPRRVMTYTNLGLLQLAGGNQKAAETAFRNAAELAPGSATAHLGLANFYAAANQIEKAELEFKAAVTAEPSDRIANQALAAFYLTIGRIDSAEPYLLTYANESQETNALLTLADYYVAGKHRDKAIPILRQLVNTKDGFTPATLRMAAIAFDSNDKPAAYKDVRSVLAAEPKNVQALVLNGRFRAADGDLADALVLARQAVAADPSQPAPHFLAGRIYNAQGRPAEAKQAFTEVLKLAPTHVVSALEIARIDFAQGEFASAAEAARRALAAQSSSSEARLLLVQSLLAQRDLNGAQLELEKLLAAPSASSEAHVAAGNLHVLKGDFTRAREAFERAVAIDPDSLGGWRGLTALDLHDKKAGTARSRIEARLAANPSQSNLLVLAAELYGTSGETERAEKMLRRALELEPSRLDAYEKLTMLYVSTNRLDQAREMFEAQAGRQPRAVGPPTMAGVILQAQNKTAEAAKRYERVLAIDSRAAVAANNLAWIYAEQNANLDIALQLAQTAKAVMPTSDSVDDTLGWVYLKKGLATLAISSLKQAVTAAPNNPVYLYHLGLAYRKNGDDYLARTTLERALKIDGKFSGADDARRTLDALKS